MRLLVMKKYFFVFILCTLTGCAHGLIGVLPETKNKDNASEIIIIRNKNFLGAAKSDRITLDFHDIIGIRVGEYTKFHVPPGQHTLGVKCSGGWSPWTKEMNIDVVCEPNKKYYFLVSPSIVCAKIEPLNEKDGLKRIAKSKHLKLVKKK